MILQSQMQEKIKKCLHLVPTPHKNLPHPPQQKSLNPLKIKALKMAPAVGIEPTTYFTAAQYLSGFQSSVGTFRVTSRSYCLH
jgi:hypothetical protein